MTTKTLTSGTFTKEVLQADKPVVVKFSAAWCAPCKMVAPLFQELSEEMSDVAYFAELDIDEGLDIAAQYKIRSVPTFLVFSEGGVIGSTGGAKTKKALEEFITDAIVN